MRVVWPSGVDQRRRLKGTQGDGRSHYDFARPEGGAEIHESIYSHQLLRVENAKVAVNEKSLARGPPILTGCFRMRAAQVASVSATASRTATCSAACT